MVSIVVSAVGAAITFSGLLSFLMRPLDFRNFDSIACCASLVDISSAHLKMQSVKS
jgi:hypothetical protein